MTIPDPIAGAKGMKYSSQPVLGTSLKMGSYSFIQASWNGFPTGKRVLLPEEVERLIPPGNTRAARAVVQTLTAIYGCGMQTI